MAGLENRSAIGQSRPAAVFTMSCGVRVRTFPTKRKMTTSPDSDSHKLSLKIIEAVREHPVLYRPSEVRSSTVKLQELRQKVWNKIADDLGLDANWMRLRWKNLRDTYSRILKNIQRADRGERRKKWIFEDDLSFLKFQYEPGDRHQIIQVSQDYIETINSSGDGTRRLLKQLEDKNDENYTEYLDVVEGSPLKTLNLNLSTGQTAIGKPTEAAATRQGDATRFYENYDPESEAGRRPDEKIYEDGKSLEVFFDRVTETVKRLPDTVQADVKTKIFQIVTEAEIKCSAVGGNNVRYVPQEDIPNLVLIPVKRLDEQNN